MDRLKRRPDAETLQLTGCLLVSAGFLVTFFLITWLGRAKLVDYDMYSDQLVARFIWEQKTLFPENWIFGNQYNVISTPVVMALFYGITGSMNEALVWGCMIMNLLLLAAYFWALRPFSGRVQLFLGLMVMLGTIISSPAAAQVEGNFLYIMANYYACYVIVMLSVWGDWVRLAMEKRKKLLSVSFAVNLVLSFLIGMQSIREFLMVMLPMLAVELLRLILLLVNQQGKIRKNQWAPGAAALLYSLSNLAGLIYVNSLGLPHTSVYGDTGLRPVSQWLGMIADGFQDLANLTGIAYFQDSRLPAPVTALAFVLWLLMVGTILWAVGILIHNVFFRRKLWEKPVDLYTLLAFVSLLGVFSANMVLYMRIRAIYYFVWILLAAFSAMTVFERCRGKGRSVLTAALCVLLLNNLVYSYSLSFLTARIPDYVKQEVADWIVEEGYDYVYGDCFIVNPLAPCADGGFITGVWGDTPFQIMEYINPTDIYTEEHNQRAVYLIDADTQADVMAELERIGGHLELQASFSDGFYQVYTSDRQLMHWGHIE